MIESIASKIIQLNEIHYNAAVGITRYRVENGVEYDAVLRDKRGVATFFFNTGMLKSTPLKNLTSVQSLRC